MKSVELRDIPPNTSELLDRLFDIVRAPNQYDDDTVEWAKDLIARVLDVFLTASVFVKMEGPTDATL